MKRYLTVEIQRARSGEVLQKTSWEIDSTLVNIDSSDPLIIAAYLYGDTIPLVKLPLPAWMPLPEEQS